ncbi:hypothetical protein [Paenibacillus macerans]|uniref:hypothetical protein n=1 Tax=Paenibacillus macerans TaxID=44252 RepID=UPI003D313940
MVVSLYGEDDRLIGRAAATGTVPRAGEDVQRLAFPEPPPAAHAAPAPSGRRAAGRYKLKIALTWEGGQSRDYVSEWVL